MTTKTRNNNAEGKSKRGFASMPEDKQKETARKGGERSHGGKRSSTQQK